MCPPVIQCVLGGVGVRIGSAVVNRVSLLLMHASYS